MGRYIIVFGIILTLTLLGVVVFWGYAGYQDYRRISETIEAIADEDEREQAWDEFGGYAKPYYGGVLLATLPGSVWVWGRAGLQAYKTDNWSVYTAFDGCSSEVLERLNVGEAGYIGQQVTSSMSQWRERVQPGDYVRVYPTTEAHLIDSVGTVGNLREIYGYNFWLFMRWGMEERCQAR